MVDEVELQFFVSRSASLARFDQIALQLAACGLALGARHAGLGVIIATTTDRSLASRLDIADVTGIRVSGAAHGAAMPD